MHYRSIKFTRGFTLLELIVVLAIIGILFSIVAVSISSVRARTRDTKRMSDMSEYRKALSLYNNEEGLYPVETTAVTIPGNNNLTTELETRGLISTAPADPLRPSLEYTYVSNLNGTTYTISFCLETSSIQGFPQGCGNTISP